MMYLNYDVGVIRQKISVLGFMDLLLAVILFVPPFIFLDSVSRTFNIKIAALELIFVAAFFIRNGIKLATVNHKVLFLFFSFVLWVTVTIFFADKMKYAFNRNLCVIMHMMFGFAVWRYVQAHSYRRIYVSYLITFSFLLPAVGTLIYSLVFNVSTASLINDHPFYSNIRHLGYHVAASLIFAILIFLLASAAYMRIICGVWLFTTVAFLLWSGSRGPIVGLFLSGLLLLLIVPVFRSRMSISIIGAALVLLSLMLILKIDFLGYGMIKRTLFANDLNSLLSGRVDIWLEALKSIDNWFVGLGGDNFVRLETARARHITQAHNVVIQALLDWGVVGAIIFMSILLGAIVKAVMIFNSLTSTSFIAVASLSLLMMYFFLSLIDGVFYHGIPFMLFVTSVALIFSFRLNLCDEQRLAAKSIDD